MSHLRIGGGRRTVRPIEGVWIVRDGERVAARATIDIERGNISIDLDTTALAPGTYSIQYEGEAAEILTTPREWR